MCATSFVGDHYRDMWTPKPWFPNAVPNTIPGSVQPLGQPILQQQVTRAEFEELKRQVLEMKDLLKRAKEYDARTGQPDCEMDEKMAILRKVAEMVGVDLGDVIPQRKSSENQPTG